MVRFDIAKAWSTGRRISANMFSIQPSKSLRSMFVAKSCSSNSPSTPKRPCLLAERTCLVFWAVVNNFFRARLLSLMALSLGYFSLKAISIFCAITTSAKCPPARSEKPHPRVSSTGAGFDKTSTKLYRTMQASTWRLPILKKRTSVFPPDPMTCFLGFGLSFLPFLGFVSWSPSSSGFSSSFSSLSAAFSSTSGTSSGAFLSSMSSALWIAAAAVSWIKCTLSKPAMFAESIIACRCRCVEKAGTVMTASRKFVASAATSEIFLENAKTCPATSSMDIFLSSHK
mmetsp:Transcript_54642/g.119800  ORF Transcript_54642/g.119800 Transcript_54642/m.119800 type:complete len:285 (-) Transcript_54642:429-1283(-)